MAKWVWIGLGVVLLAIGTAGYVLNSGAPAPPKGVCPALLSAAPVDANAVMYADLTQIRSADFSKQFSAFEQSPQAAAYRDFVDKTNFHLDRDLDHVLLAFSTESAAGALLLDGRFDQGRIAGYVASYGTMKHYPAGDLYDFRPNNGAAPGANNESISMMFLGPNRVALAAGRDPHTELLMIADSVNQPDPNLHADLCERAERIAGAPFFMLGDFPKSAMAQMAPVVARQNPSAGEIVQQLRAWDMAYWMDGDNVRIAVEGQFDSTYDALGARFEFEKVRESFQKTAASLKSAPMAANPAAPVFEMLAKNMAVSVDGRYLRIGSMLKKSDLQSFAASAARTGQRGRL